MIRLFRDRSIACQHFNGYTEEIVELKSTDTSKDIKNKSNVKPSIDTKEVKDSKVKLSNDKGVIKDPKDLSKLREFMNKELNNNLDVTKGTFL